MDSSDSKSILGLFSSEAQRPFLDLCIRIRIYLEKNVPEHMTTVEQFQSLQVLAKRF